MNGFGWMPDTDMYWLLFQMQESRLRTRRAGIEFISSGKGWFIVVTEKNNEGWSEFFFFFFFFVKRMNEMETYSHPG